MATHPLIKIFIIAVFIAILVSLATAFFRLFRGRDSREGTGTVKALTVRVILSVGLVLTIIVLNALGLIKPNG